MKQHKWIVYAIIFFIVLLILVLLSEVIWATIRTNNWGFVRSETATSDLDECKEILQEYHPLCKNKLPDETQKIYDQLMQKYHSRLFISGREETSDLQKFTRSLDDAHTGIMVQGEFAEYCDDAKSMEVNTISFDYRNGYIYMQQDQEEYEVISINGYTVEEIIQHCKTYEEHENEYGLTKVIRGFNNRGRLVWLNLAKSNDKYVVVEYQDDSGTKAQKFLYTNLKKTEQEDADEWSYQIEKDKNYALLILHTCNPSNEFCIFLQEFFEEVDKNGINNVAIDLRDNTGGGDISRLLLSYLGVDQYYGNGRYPSEGEYGLQKRSILYPVPDCVFHGNLYVFLSCETFSAAKDLAVILSINNLATIIGEPSSQNVNGYTGIHICTFGNGKFIMQVSQQYIYAAPLKGNLTPVDIRCDPENAIKVFEKKIK